MKRSKGTFMENGCMRISEAAGRAVEVRAWKLIRGVSGEGKSSVVGGEGCGAGLPRPQAEPGWS